MRTFTFFLAVSFLAFTQARAEDTLKSLSLNEKEKIATACATTKILQETEFFSHSSFSGYVIKISDDQSLLSNYAGNEEICVKGPYRIDSKGFAPQLLIQITSVESKDNAPLARELFESDALAEPVSEVADEWINNNITDGTTRLRAGTLRKKPGSEREALRTLSEKNFKEEWSLDEYNTSPLPKDLKLKTTTSKYSAAKDLKMAVDALAEGNDFAPRNKADRTAIRKDLKKVIKLLGKNAALMTLVTTTQIAHEGEKSDMRNVYSILFLNKDTKKILRIFVIQGKS